MRHIRVSTMHVLHHAVAMLHNKKPWNDKRISSTLPRMRKMNVTRKTNGIGIECSVFVGKDARQSTTNLHYALS